MKTFEQNLYHFPLNVIAELIDITQHQKDLQRIEDACFPQQMRDSRHDLEEFFSDEHATGLILYQDATPIGYISATHANDINTDSMLSEHPLLLNNSRVTCYVDSIAILEPYRSITTLDFLIHEFTVLMKDIDYRYMTAHLRKKGGFSRLMQRRFGVQVLRCYDNWCGFNEPFDFIFGDLTTLKTLPFLVDYCFHKARQIRRKLKISK